MENTVAPPSRSEWTLADFLSTYRYWALFLSSLFLAIGEQGFNALFPLSLQSLGMSIDTVGTFYSSANFGWLIGAFVAFFVAGRNAWLALTGPLAVCALVALGFLLVPTLWESSALLFLFGLSVGAVRAVFPIAIAIFLVGGRPGKIDFGCALTLMSTTIMLSAFAPVAASQLYQISPGGFPLMLAFIVCLMLAAVALAPAGSLSFDQPPRPRHKPLEPQRRSPVVVAIVLTIPVILAVVATIGLYVLQPNELESPAYSVILLSAVLTFIVAIGVLIYFAYWVYRIHGELAGAARSQRLLTPLAAMFVALLVPLGLPVLLMTLGDLLNDRGRSRGRGALLSMIWLGIWSFVFPPVAVGLIQNAANKSYDMG